MRGFLTEEVDQDASLLYERWRTVKPLGKLDEVLERLYLAYADTPVAPAKQDLLDGLNNFDAKFMHVTRKGGQYVVVAITSITPEQLGEWMPGELVKIGMADAATKVFVLENKLLQTVVIGRIDPNTVTVRQDSPLSNVLVVVKL